MQPRIYWVVALKPEAAPLIRAFRLRARRGAGALFPWYSDTEGRVNLVISGPGRVNAAAATAWLAAAAWTPEEGKRALPSGWINFGVAGSGRSDYGEIFLASRIRQAVEGRSWYPVATWAKSMDLPRREILTVDNPVSEYPGDALVEMEASGFYPVALRSASSELCHVVKVVSDDPDHSLEGVTKEAVAELCESAFARMRGWLEAFSALLAEEQVRLSDPSGFREWCAAVHFSETQRHQLHRLLRAWQALDGTGAEDLIPPPPSGGVRAADALRGLREDLERRRGQFRAGS